MAEYKGKLLKGLFAQAKNVLTSNGDNVEDLSASVISQAAGKTLTITGFGTMTFYNAVTNCIVSLPFIPNHQISYSGTISVHGGSDYSRSGTISANVAGLRITDIPEGRNGTFSYSITFTF